MNSFISIIYPALGNFNLASIFLLGKDDSGNVLSSSWELSDLSESQREAYNTLVANGDYPDISAWNYENETGGSTISIPSGANIVRLSCYFQHVIGEATSLIKVSSNNGLTQGNTIGSIVVRQLA